jgi:hypothetical protein
MESALNVLRMSRLKLGSKRIVRLIHLFSVSNMPKRLSKKAKEGLEWGVSELRRLLTEGMKPEKALNKIGVRGFWDTYTFFEYLDQYGHKDLIDMLK